MTEKIINPSTEFTEELIISVIPSSPCSLSTKLSVNFGLNLCRDEQS